MKVIQYHLIRKVNLGTPADPVWQEVRGAAVVMEYSEDNLEIAKSEAWEGAVEVVEGTLEEPYGNS